LVLAEAKTCCLTHENEPSQQVKSSHIYLYSTFYNTDCLGSALQR